MTIKEAFQQLANATKTGMKNPFFIMRSLNKNFSEIADKIEGGGSADIEYSTTERKIGKWIDGKDLYEKTVECGALPNNTTKTVAHSIENIGCVVSIQGSAKNPTNGIQAPLPYVYGNVKCLQVYANSTSITLISTENMSVYTDSYITIRYTKTA